MLPKLISNLLPLHGPGKKFKHKRMKMRMFLQKIFFSIVMKGAYMQPLENGANEKFNCYLAPNINYYAGTTKRAAN